MYKPPPKLTNKPVKTRSMGQATPGWEAEYTTGSNGPKTKHALPGATKAPQPKTQPSKTTPVWPKPNGRPAMPDDLAKKAQTWIKAKK
jgi:hypothetical protein